jgi:hypothetical protein
VLTAAVTAERDGALIRGHTTSVLNAEPTAAHHGTTLPPLGAVEGAKVMVATLGQNPF